METRVEVTLTEREREMLIAMLQSEVTELRSGIYHAESHDVKETLKEREECARGLLERLQAAAPAGIELGAR